MKQTLFILALLCTLTTVAQKKSATKNTKKTSETKKTEEAEVVETMIMEAEAPIDLGVAEDREGTYSSRNFKDGDDLCFISDANSKTGLCIAYKGIDYKDRVYALIEYDSKKKLTPFIFERMSGAIYNEPVQLEVSLNNRYGVIDGKGKTIIPVIYENLNAFTASNMRYYVVTLNGYAGVIDQQNKTVIPFEYENISTNYGSANLLTVKKNGHYGMLNVFSGKLEIPIEYDEMSNYSSNELFIVKKNKLCNIIPSGSNELLFKKWYHNLVVIGSQRLIADNGDKSGLIDMREKTIIPFEYDELKRLSSYSRNEVLAAKKKGKYGLLDESGKVIIPFEYDQFAYTGSDLIIVSRGMKKGLLDNNGKIVLPVEYDDLDQLNDFYIVRKKNKMNVVDKKAALLFDNDYDEVRYAQLDNDYGKYFFVTRHNKKGFVDALGKVRIPVEYDALIPAQKSYYNRYIFKLPVIAVKNNKWGMLDGNGKIVVPFDFDNMSYINPFLVIVGKDGKYGVRDIYKGEMIVPMRYDYLTCEQNKLVGYQNGFEKFRVAGRQVLAD